MRLNSKQACFISVEANSEEADSEEASRGKELAKPEQAKQLAVLA